MPELVKRLTITLLILQMNMYNWEGDVSYYPKLTGRMSVFNYHSIIRLIKDKYKQSFDFNNLSILNLNLCPQFKC